MYLAIGTHPEVGKLAEFPDCYTTVHWHAAIRVVRYLTGTRDLTLILGGTLSPGPLGFSNSDYANDLTKRKSAMGYTFSLRSGTISWA
jgi:hypothetical protein